jgi:alkanesulfonate monooxygenase SsuD/methylene tetrahydromethanopterin reductase-like flavin-dependent oxidoreductase (luciferase family)
MALQAATLNELAGGRLILGLGLQARGYVEGWHGQRYERPVRAMREYLTILRQILGGESVTFEGEIFSVRGFQLTMQPPERPPRIYMAAIGPQMLRLAGELADGVLGYCWSLEYLRTVVLPKLQEGAERAGRSLDGFDIACGFPALVGERALDQIRGQAMMFATAGGSSPEYEKSFAAAGFGVEVGQIAQHFALGDVPAALDVVTEEMADAVTIAGPPDHVRERVEAYRAAGLDTLALNPAPPDVFFPLYEGHFPEGAAFPEFSFPAYLDAFDGVLSYSS